MNCAEPLAHKGEAETVLSPLEWFGQRREQRGRLGFILSHKILLGISPNCAEILQPLKPF